MGRIRQVSIKKHAKKLVEEFPEDFSGDFSKNKENLKELKVISSKKNRNRVAGYVVSVVKNKSF